MNLILIGKELEKSTFRVRDEAAMAIEKINRSIDLGGMTQQQRAFLLDAVKGLEKIVKGTS